MSDNNEGSPCDGCGVYRTRAEGGRLFTLCDEYWDKPFPENILGPSCSPAEMASRIAKAKERLGVDAAAKAQGAAEATARIVAHLRARVRERQRLASAIPLGRAISGGPFDGAPAYDLELRVADGITTEIEIIERGDHITKESNDE